MQTQKRKLLTPEELKKQLDKMNVEEKADLLRSYRNAVGKDKPRSIEDLIIAKTRGASDTCIRNFNHVLTQVLHPAAPYVFVPAYALKAIYLHIQAVDDVYAKRFSQKELKEHIRRFLLEHEMPFEERSWHLNNRMRFVDKNGNSQECNAGYAKHGQPAYVGLNIPTWPHNCLHYPRVEKADHQRLHIIHRRAVMDAMSKSNYTWQPKV